MSDLDRFRKEKDAFYRDDPQSPLMPAQRRTFKGLAYYPEDPALSIVATPKLLDPPESVTMQTSTGDEAQYLRWATIAFEVAGQPVELMVYRSQGGDLFLPFQDANAGSETYGAGRYLEVDVLASGDLLVDFNYAYNPYCAYNDGYSCPVPPPENRLKVAIRAGEKNFAQ